MEKCNIMKTYFTILFFLFSNICFSQYYGEAGKSMNFTFKNWIVEKQISELSFKLASSNPTVFFVDSIKINDLYLMDLERNYFEINCSAQNLNTSEINLTIYGTALAGNDTITNLLFFDIIVNENNLKIDTTVSIISKNPLIHSNYAKFAKISNIYPNPAIKNTTFNVEYFADLPSSIKFKIFNVVGEQIWQTEFYKEKIGRDNLTIDLDSNSPMGKYWIFLETELGTHFYPFVLIK